MREMSRVLRVEGRLGTAVPSQENLRELWRLVEWSETPLMTFPAGITVYDMKRSSRVLAVSVQPEAARDFERIAEEEGRNKSELFREMLRVYRIWRETQRFEYLQRSFAAKARERGVATEKDVERLIQEVRRS